jgi:glycosyltransferase involved in cell wall biosynthesis
MKRSNSDIYYQRGAGAETGQVAGWCRMRRKKFVHAVAHEPDCCRELSKLHNLRERVLYRWGLKLADEVIVQTATQQRLLQEQFGRTSCVVQNCAVPISMSSNNDSREPVSEGGSVLWIGRLHPVKRFEWLLELAKRMHQTEFVVIGGANVETEYDRQLVGRVKDLSNVRFLGEIPYEKMGAHYREARVLCCTSVKEGFPNVFLEAWRTGVPVVSTVDPDGVVERNGLGVIANTLDELESALRQLVSTGHRYDDMSRRCRSYFLENHTPEKTLAAFERVLHTL